MLFLTILPGSANLTGDSFMIFDAHSEGFGYGIVLLYR